MRLLILSLGLLADCSSWPDNFEDLSLDPKIEAYELLFGPLGAELQG